MNEILLRPGEALRIENDGGRVVIEIRLAARRASSRSSTSAS